MNTDVYSVEGVVETLYDAATKTMTCTWLHLGPHAHLRPCLQAQVDCVIAYDTQAIIVDTTDSKGVLTQEDQAWIGEYVFPTYQAQDLKVVITVLPKSALASLAAKHWQKTGSTFGFDFMEADSLATAKQIVAELAA